MLVVGRVADTQSVLQEAEGDSQNWNTHVYFLAKIAGNEGTEYVEYVECADYV